MGHLPPLDVGALERWGWLMLRPHLRIVYQGERKKEVVSVKYSFDEYQRLDFLGSSAQDFGNYSLSHTSGEALYIRARVFNDWGFPARNCEVYVERIWLNERLIDDERSPLHWTDFSADAYTVPMMRQGHRYGRYIDICASDSIDKRFQVISQKWTKGYHRFRQSGTYKLELSAEGATPCSYSHFMLIVGYHAEQWKELTVISANEARKWWTW
jgi:hypothetical protein